MNTGYYYFCVNDGLTGINYKCYNSSKRVPVHTGIIYKVKKNSLDFISHNAALAHEPTNVEIIVLCRGDLDNAQELPE